MQAAGVLATLFLLGVAPVWVLGLLRLASAEDTAALMRADLATTWASLRERWDAQPDDAPLWAEVLGLLVPAGLLFRAASHVFVAELQGIDGHLAERDVTAANAVAAVREGEDWLADFNARVTALVAGCVLWWCYAPGAGPTLAIDTTHALAGVVQWYVVANIGVLLADPLLFAVHRSLTNTTETTHGLSTR